MDYKAEVQKLYKPLTKSEQILLYEKMKAGDMSARNELVESCLPMVIKLADKFAVNNKHIDFEDLLQEGNMALVRAVNVFDPYKYGAISTLAWWAINNALISATHKSNYKMKHPYSVSSYASKMMKDISASDTLDNEAIAKKLKRKVTTIKRMKEKIYSRTGMFSTSVVEREVKKEEVPDHFCLGYLVDILNDVKVVDPKNSVIFKEYYGLSGEKSKTSKEIAHDYSMETKSVTDIIKKVRRDITKIAKKEKEDAKILR
jgi:RNA polymerase primary sigma factor